jgi:hypothetical protein
MYSKAISAGLVLLSSAFVSGPVHAADDSFLLVKQDDKVSVYGKRPENCVSDGASVMFVVENRTKERLELKLELLNMKVKNKLTVMVEPSGNTSVLSLSPDPEACHTELVDMKVSPVSPKVLKQVPAAVPSAPAPANPVAADRVM